MRFKVKMTTKSPILDLQHLQTLLPSVLKPVPCSEASHAVHLPRRIDERPSVTALVCGPRILYSIPSCEWLLWERAVCEVSRSTPWSVVYSALERNGGSRGICQVVDGVRKSRMED